MAFLFKSLKDKKAKYLAEYLEEKGIDIYSPRSGKFFERDEIRFVIGLFLCIFHQEKDKKAKYLAEYLEEKGIDIYSPRSGKFFERDEIRFVIGLFLCIFHQEKNYQKYDYYNECYEFAKKEIREDLEIRDYIVEKRKNIEIFVN